MKNLRPIAVLILSCVVSSAAGWWLALPAHPSAIGFSVRSASGHFGGVKTDTAVGGVGSSSHALLPLTENALQQKILAKAKTEDLWAWLLQMQKDHVPYEGLNKAILAEVTERLGWAAWDRALALDDAAAREGISGGVLNALAHRDPWKACAAWKEHEEEFTLNWGLEAPRQAVIAAAGVSASALLEMLDSARDAARLRRGPEPDYAPGFDFQAVMDGLKGHEFRGLTPENLLQEWARQSPVATSRWLADHPADNKGPEALGEIAAMKPDTPGRAEALEILSHVPPVYGGNWWAGKMLPGGALSPEMLATATGMQRREDYLSSTLAQTLYCDALDPSWQQIPVQERVALIGKAESTMPPIEELGPPERLQRERWRRIVATGGRKGP